MIRNGGVPVHRELKDYKTWADDYERSEVKWGI